MKRRGLSSTSALLQKVTSQLKGERVKQHEVDDLDVYIASLAEKTSHQKYVDYEEDDDDDDHISMPNDTYNHGGTAYPSYESKFLKKSKGVSSLNHMTPTSTVVQSSYIPTKHTGKKNMSSTSSLNKDPEITSKLHQTSFHASQNIYNLDLSESDSSYNDLANNPRHVSSDTQRPSAVSSEESSIGRNGNMFLKKHTNLPVDDQNIQEGITKNRHRNMNLLKDVDSVDPWVDVDRESLMNEAQLQQPSLFYKDTHSSKLLSSNSKQLTTSKSVSPFYKADRSNSKTKFNNDTANLLVNSGSPFYGKSSSGYGQKEKSSTSFSSDGDSKPNNGSLYYDKEKQTVTKTKNLSDEKSAESCSALKMFGLHDVDELMTTVSDNESVMSSASNIQKFVNLHDEENSASEILTDSRGLYTGHRDSAKKYTHHSYSNRSHSSANMVTRRITPDLTTDRLAAPFSNAQNFQERYDDRENTVNDYTEDFSIELKDERTITDCTESYSDRFEARRDESKSVVQMCSVEVQTSMPDKSYTQYSGIPMAAFQPAYDFATPTPIALHIVSTEYLEEMTNFSPTSLILHDMLKQQLHLTQRFLHAQKDLFDRWTQVPEDHTFRYTTLEDTKAYIEKHRKKRLTFKDALKMVKTETSLSNP